MHDPLITGTEPFLNVSTSPFPPMTCQNVCMKSSYYRWTRQRSHRVSVLHPHHFNPTAPTDCCRNTGQHKKVSNQMLQAAGRVLSSDNPVILTQLLKKSSACRSRPPCHIYRGQEGGVARRRRKNSQTRWYYLHSPWLQTNTL